MQANDWIDGIGHLGPWIVAVVAIVTWGLKNSVFAGGRFETRRQTELLERIAAQLDKKA
jgi:hypothetical protein